MTPRQAILTMSAMALGIASAQAATFSIPIVNPLFIDDQLSCTAGGLTCFAPGATGWLVGPQTGVELVSSAQYPFAPPEGFYVLAVGYTNVTGSVMQTLGDTLQANTTYVLKLKIGARADVPFTGYVASLMAGNFVLASNNSATPVGGTFVTDVIVYSSGANPPQLGKPLQIFAKGLGFGQFNIAEVSLTAHQ